MSPVRYRIQFEKGSQMRFTSHLDTYRALERTFRRAHLPLVYSQGYNPHPKLSLAAALPLGITSDCELADFWLDSDQPADWLHDVLNDKAPPGLTIMRVNQIDQGEPALQVQIQSASYSLTIPNPPPEAEIQVVIEDLLAADQLPRERRGKPYDLRPLIEALWIESHSPQEAIIYARLSAREGQTGRPEEILLAMGFDPTSARIHRQSLHLLESPATSGTNKPAT